MQQISPQVRDQNKGVLSRMSAHTALWVFAPLSLVQFYIIARLINPLFIGTPLNWVASIRLPAFLLSVWVISCFGRESLQRPSNLKRYLWLVFAVAVVLIGTYVLIYVVQVWVPKLPTAGGLVIFLGTGLFAEEFWFRGTIFSLAQQNYSRHQKISVVLFSAACYGLSHWQYHGFGLTVGAATQITYTFLLGLVLGLLRQQTQSLWPTVLLHFAVNIIAVVAVGGI